MCRLVYLLFGMLLGASAIAAAIERKGESRELTKSKATAGNPLAPWLLEQMVGEISDGFKSRGIEHRFAAFQAYAGEQLDSTAGQARSSEVTGNCRLKWYGQLMRSPLEAPGAAEQFTRQLHKALRGEATGFDQALIIARQTMDDGKREPQKLPEIQSAELALGVLKQVLAKAQAHYAASIAPLSEAERTYLRQQVHPILTAQGTIGHTLWDRSTGRYICDLLEKMNRKALFDGADAMVPLSDPVFLAELAKMHRNGQVTVEGVNGAVLESIDTPTGKVVIGGRGNNVYELDKMAGVCAVVDLGGDDIYREGAVSAQRPILVLLDLGGNDRYEGSQPGIQGGAMLGVSMLVDLAGDDVYEAKDLAQGAVIGGVGILIDRAGNDRYRGLRRVQGQALFGVAILLDRAGKDEYHAAMRAQGFGGPLGFGVLNDLEGNDHYYCGGMWRTSYYPETQGYEAWGQGVGVGLRGVTNGGIGVILDGSGDDLYEYDYFAQGGGYWLGAGFIRDFHGNDRRLGSTRKEHDGSYRVQPLFGRFTCGFGCHYAIGFCFDDHGNDTYGGTIMGLGFSWTVRTAFSATLTETIATKQVAA